MLDGAIVHENCGKVSDNVEIYVAVLWKLNPAFRTITLTKNANYTCKLHTKETEYGAEH